MPFTTATPENHTPHADPGTPTFGPAGHHPEGVALVVDYRLGPPWPVPLADPVVEVGPWRVEYDALADRGGLVLYARIARVEGLRGSPCRLLDFSPWMRQRIADAVLADARRHRASIWHQQQVEIERSGLRVACDETGCEEGRRSYLDLQGPGYWSRSAGMYLPREGVEECPTCHGQSELRMEEFHCEECPEGTVHLATDIGCIACATLGRLLCREHAEGSGLHLATCPVAQGRKGAA